jgi:uncharacterized protein YdeI (YjbR/CyaY-like superfamily)
VVTGPADDLPVVTFPTPAEWEAWVEAHPDGPGAWLKIAKKGSGAASVTYAQAVEVALCWGWIDGQVRALDDHWYLQRFTPRRARSGWSRINVGKVEELRAAGRMRPRGEAEVAAAQADGRWERAYHPPSNRELPPELAAALDASPKAKAAFDALGGANRYAITYRVSAGKQAATRERNAAKFVAMLERGETIH